MTFIQMLCATKIINQNGFLTILTTENVTVTPTPILFTTTVC